MTADERAERLKRTLISPGSAISEAIRRLDDAGTGVLLLCEADGRLAGVLTDGDIRRAMLRGVSFDRSCDSIASRTPVVVPPDVSAVEALRRMNEADVNQLPVVDPQTGKVVDLLLRRDLVTEEELSVAAVVMAGGFGTRLRPLTDDLPKPMLRVGDRPLLERTIEQLRDGRDPPRERDDALSAREDHGPLRRRPGLRRGDRVRHGGPAARERPAAWRS